VEAPPWIALSTPTVSVPFTIPPIGTDFVVQVADATPGGTIYYQWVFEYPPFASNLTRPVGGVQKRQAAPVGQLLEIDSTTISCTSVNPAPNSGPNHLLALILADAPFSTFLLGEFDDGSGMAPTYIWPVDMPCPATTVTP